MLDLVLAVALGAGATGCLAEWEPVQAPDRPNVVVFGDSNVRFSQSTAAELWGDVAVSYNAEAGAEVDRWATEMDEVPDDSTVIIALGANDVLDDLMVDAEADVRRAAEQVSNAECVVWLTVNEATFTTLGWPYDVRAAHINEVIRSLGTVWVDDWSATAAPHPEWLNEDHIHHTIDGIVAYASELVGAKELCP